MYKIRTSVFETNSSSMHSICIANNKTMNRYKPREIVKGVDRFIYKDGTINLYEDDLYFGRYPFEILFSLYSKTLYAIASFSEERLDEIVRVFKKAYNDSLKIILEQNPDDEMSYFENFNFPKNGDRGNYYGNIDHQSDYVLQNFLDRNHVTLEEFLLNPRYIIVIDGDEYFMLDKYQEAGFLTEISHWSVKND